MLCHAEFSIFAGGYVGVDVFFVISGFLITRIIMDEIERQQFSLLRFYERRTRRILPALFFMMMLITPAAFVTMLPDFLQNFGQSLVATTLFSNNLLLYMTSGYWDLESSFKPLLHTWSLGVEEQYYFFTPLLLMAVAPFSKFKRGWLIAILGVLSFVLYLTLSLKAPNFAFYQLPTRAWELLLGAGAVLWERARPKPPSNQLAALVGLVMIVGSILSIRPGSFGGSAAIIIPCVGAALVLVFARVDTKIGAILSVKPVAWIGLISYSLYLWHQPVFAFTRILSLEAPSAYLMAAMILPTFGLAYLSWRFIEQPFRDHSIVPTRALLFFLAPMGVCLCAIGLWLHLDDGAPWRVYGNNQGGAMDNTIRYNESVFAYKLDRFANSGAPRLLVIGNSQGRDFVNMSRETGRFSGYDLVYRDDIDLCAPETLTELKLSLIADADYMVLTVADPLCPAMMARPSAVTAKRIVFVGPKHFGYNLNRFIFLPRAMRAEATAKIPKDIVESNRVLRGQIPQDQYVDTLSHLSSSGDRTPVFNAAGLLLTPDRVHLTRAGAQLIGARIFSDPAWQDFPLPVTAGPSASK